MNTLFFKEDEDLTDAAHILRSGGLVAAPTETVYGLCANALDEKAVASIYTAKGRPSDNPLIVHIADLDMLKELVAHIPDAGTLLINTFWPGPLTLIFEASDKVPSIVRAGLSTVGVRLPSHPVMQQLIRCSGLPLAAPSANRSGSPSPTNSKRVLEDLCGKIHAVIDGGECCVGLESTIVDVSCEPPMILRPGGITLEALKKVIPSITIDPALAKETSLDLKPKAPGMKYTHYAPIANVVLVSGEKKNVIKTINHLVKKETSLGKKVGVLASDETQDFFECTHLISLGSLNDLEKVGAHLFEALRTFDDLQMDTVYSIVFPKEGIGHAIMNRLEKSAGHEILYV
jgi:L-threonylcarbamoyladenylate synthase